MENFGKMEHIFSFVGTLTNDVDWKLNILSSWFLFTKIGLMILGLNAIQSKKHGGVKIL
jgi:hypothetical protein